jgi:hypothetical protein
MNLQQILELVRAWADRKRKRQDSDDGRRVVDDAKKTQSGTSSNKTDEDSSSDEELDIVWPPYVEWPRQPTSPKNTIEIQLYWREDNPDGKKMCRQCVPYLKYCFLDAWAKRGYDVSVTVCPEPVPKGVDEPGEFNSWFWKRDDMAKDANILLAYLGGAGSAGGYGGYVDAVEYLEGWDFDPTTDKIKNVGGGKHKEGVARVIHETGHCLGLGHEGGEIRLWGEDWLSPMRVSYDEATRFAFELHPKNKKVEPKVMK